MPISNQTNLMLGLNIVDAAENPEVTVEPGEQIDIPELVVGETLESISYANNVDQPFQAQMYIPLNQGNRVVFPNNGETINFELDDQQMIITCGNNGWAYVLNGDEG